MSTARDALVAARDAVQAEIDKIDKFVTDSSTPTEPPPPVSASPPAEVPAPATPEPGSNDAPAVHETAASQMAAQVAEHGDVKPVWDAPDETYTAPDPLEPAS